MTEENIVAFVNGGHYTPATEDQIELVSKFFDVVQTAIEIGANKLGLVHSLIIEREFWLRIADGGYYVINPDQNVQTVLLASLDMVKSSKNIGIIESQIVEITASLSAKIEALV